ncbi:MAG: hypothetical protein ACK4MD_06990 [Demequina sp.]
MTAKAEIRRRAGQRISSALWGLLVMGVGALTIAAYSGYEIDLELAAIIVLAAIGGWLLVSAAVSGIGRKREIARATAPTVEERVDPARPAPWSRSAEPPLTEQTDEVPPTAEFASATDMDETTNLDVAKTAELRTDGESGRG